MLGLVLALVTAVAADDFDPKAGVALDPGAAFWTLTVIGIVVVLVFVLCVVAVDTVKGKWFNPWQAVDALAGAK